MANGAILVDGSSSWGAGVDSIKVPTIQSSFNPDGLQRNQNAWLVNCGDRDGGITQRAGWQPEGFVSDGTALYQGGIVYNPVAGDPYLICLIGGHVFSVTLSNPPIVTDLSIISSEFMPANQVQAFFVQAEEFVVIQAGDLTTAPIFYEPNHVPFPLWRSAGIVAYPGVSELPPAGPMVYYQGRIWMGQWNGVHRMFNAGDIVYGPSGTLTYQFRDSVLKVTENQPALGGDGFTIPGHSGDIRALAYSANLDVTLGQGTLFIFTAKQIYSLFVPLTRQDWINATNPNGPTLTVVQITNGSVNDRSLVAVNGDLFFQTLDTNIASLKAAVRYFEQWGQKPISANEHRILSRNDRSLLRFVSGIEFDNRLLMGALPKQLPQGVVCQAIVPLDFTPITSFAKDTIPAWEGHYEGLDHLQLFSADFGGLERAFSLVVSSIDSTIQLWELTLQEQFENGDNRINWSIESPSFEFQKPFDLKRLVSLELWFDRLWGTVDFEVYYRPDQYPCPLLWAKFTECAARNCDEDVNCSYPVLDNYREQYRATKVLGLPPNAGCNVATSRPFNIGYQFQIILKITGFCRIRSVLLKALPMDKPLYENLTGCS